MKKILKIIAEHLILGANLLLESIGCGLGWEYYNKRIPIYNEWTESHDREVKMLFRKSKYSSRHEYRTMLPGCDGYDPNEWVPYDGKDFELRIIK